MSEPSVTVKLSADTTDFESDMAKMAKVAEKTAAIIRQAFEKIAAVGAPKPIAYLEPGKIYVIKARFRTDEAAATFRADLHKWAPDCRFLIFDPGAELMSTIPVTEDPATKAEPRNLVDDNHPLARSARTWEEILEAVGTADKMLKEYVRPDQEARVELTVRTLSYAECMAKGIPVD